MPSPLCAGKDSHLEPTFTRLPEPCLCMPCHLQRHEASGPKPRTAHTGGSTRKPRTLKLESETTGATGASLWDIPDTPWNIPDTPCLLDNPSYPSSLRRAQAESAALAALVHEDSLSTLPSARHGQAVRALQLVQQLPQPSPPRPAKCCKYCPSGQCKRLMALRGGG